MYFFPSDIMEKNESMSVEIFKKPKIVKRKNKKLKVLDEDSYTKVSFTVIFPNSL